MNFEPPVATIPHQFSRIPTTVTHTIHPYKLIGTLLSLVCILSGCNSALRMPGSVFTLDPLKARAEQRVAAQDYQGAAQVYLDRASGLPPGEAGHHQLTAVDYLLRGRQWQAARNLIDQLNPPALSGPDQDHLKLARTRLLLVDQQTDAALLLLSEIKSPDLLPNAGLDYYRLLAAANAAAGNLPEAIKQLVWMDGLLTRRGAIQRNQQDIWNKLSGLPDAQMQNMRQFASRDTLGGWVELAYLIRLNQYSSAGIEATLDAWRRDYPGHPAEQSIISALKDQLPLARELTGRIAVLLPLSGRTAKQATAIRDGIMLAHSQNALSENEIMVFDTDSGPVWEKYQQAAMAGADFIIGPLLKSRISELANAGQLTIPVLALNQTDQDIGFSQPIYQFGLNPQDEAAQAAQRAFLDGHKRMVALIPEGAWGERLLQAFTQVWHANEGTLLAVERYPAKTVDFTKQITHALGLDDSQRRYKSLQRKLGRKIEFEPRRRQDVDAVFIVAFPREARLIRPQLQFHRASELPIYATSHIYTGIPDPERDRDLNTIRFCDTPWTLGETGDSVLLRSKISALWDTRADRYQRLFALGIDAYRVIPRLDSLGLQNSANFNGMTGILTLDETRRLHRRLECAIFKKGIPDNLGSIPELPPSNHDQFNNDTIERPNAVIEWSTR